MAMARYFLPISLDKSFPRTITCFETWGDNVCVGTQDGYAELYKICPNTTDPKISTTLLGSRQFTTKSVVTQIQVFRALKLLVILTAGSLTVHSSKDLTPLSVISISKVTRFCINSRKGADSHYLCASTSYDLFIYQYSEERFAFCKQFSVPATPETFAWVGRWLILGFRKEYDVLNVETSKVHTLVTLDGRSPPIISTILPHFFILLNNNKVTLYDAEGENIITIESYSFGNWTPGILPFLGFSYPYIVSMTKKAVTIHNVQLSRESRTSSQPGCCYLTRQGRKFFVATSDKIYLYVLPPLSSNNFYTKVKEREVSQTEDSSLIFHDEQLKSFMGSIFGADTPLRTLLHNLATKLTKRTSLAMGTLKTLISVSMRVIWQMMLSVYPEIDTLELRSKFSMLLGHYYYPLIYETLMICLREHNKEKDVQYAQKIAQLIKAKVSPRTFGISPKYWLTVDALLSAKGDLFTGSLSSSPISSITEETEPLFVTVNPRSRLRFTHNQQLAVLLKMNEEPTFSQDMTGWQQCDQPSMFYQPHEKGKSRRTCFLWLQPSEASQTLWRFELSEETQNTDWSLTLAAALNSLKSPIRLLEISTSSPAVLFKILSLSLSSPSPAPSQSSPSDRPFSKPIALVEEAIATKSPLEKLENVRLALQETVHAVSNFYRCPELGVEVNIDADELVNLFAYVVAKSNIQDVYSNICFLTEFTDECLHSGQIGYSMTTFQVVVEIIMQVDPQPGGQVPTRASVCLSPANVFSALSYSPAHPPHPPPVPPRESVGSHPHGQVQCAADYMFDLSLSSSSSSSSSFSSSSTSSRYGAANNTNTLHSSTSALPPSQEAEGQGQAGLNSSAIQRPQSSFTADEKDWKNMKDRDRSRYRAQSMASPQVKSLRESPNSPPPPPSCRTDVDGELNKSAVNWYSCSINMVRGWLYVSPVKLSFRSMFGGQSVEIYLKDIESLHKTKLFGILDASLKITLKSGQEHTFVNFIQRDQAINDIYNQAKMKDINFPIF